MASSGGNRPGWLENYVAIVTGGGRGIGLAVARRYLAEGASVVALDRDPGDTAPTVAEHPDRFRFIAGDVRDPAAHAAAVETAETMFGAVDVLVGNAGIFDFWRTVDRYAPEQLAENFDEVFHINVKGYLLAFRAAQEALRRSRGSAIFTASVASFNAGGGGVLYTASKHAVVGLVRQLARENMPDVRVNGVAPGATTTRLSGSATMGEEARSVRPMIDKIVAQGIAAQTPEDHAGTYVFLASRENAPAITGQVILSDGGLQARR